MNAFLTARLTARLLVLRAILLRAILRPFVLRATLLCAALLAAGALLFSSSPVGAAGAAGQAVALRAALDPAATRALLQKGLPTTPGRFVYDPKSAQYASGSGQDKHVQDTRVSGLRRRPAVALTSPVQIAEPTQTYDVFAPPPAFTPGDGALTPANAFPVWTADQRYLVFARQVEDTDMVVRTHLFSVSADGDVPGGTSTLHQITTGSGNEAFPALNPSNNGQLAFTSTAVTGVANLYVVQGFSPQTTVVDPSTLTSLTVRTDLSTGFGAVGRPTWNPSGLQLVFAATDMGGAHTGVSHLYSLYLSSEGGVPASSPSATNPPAKITDGPGNDTDPAWSPDGQVIAFAHAPAPGGMRSLYLFTGNAAPTQLTNNGTDDFSPAWNTAVSSASTGQLAFSRGTLGGSHDVYYYQAYVDNANGVAQLQPESQNNVATLLNSDDTGNVYDDVYPAFSPSLTTPQIVYQSDRSITYNNIADGSPSETAVSLARGTTGAFGVTVGSGYEGLLVSRIADVDPPTLLPFTPGEVVHVTDAAGTVRRNGDLVPGKPVTFTVRLSSREAGVDGNNVYLQFKDPDSRYQDTNIIAGAGLEHKVFTQDAIDSASTAAGVSNGDFGSATAYLFNGGSGDALGTYTVGTATVAETLRGAVGGYDGTYSLAVGRNGTGINPVTYTQTINNVPTTVRLPGGNPTNFTTFGQEYECQWINAALGAANAMTGAPAAAYDAGANAGDYGTPYYLAGVDDQGAGSAPTPRPEWLKLARSATQDTNGGVQYTATWTSPLSPSDFYIDVIAYDKASNWRIYDNVWGFSTQPFSGTNDILVVSDNTLGQKFVASTFGNFGLKNITPTFYGAESYFTDYDLDRLPTAVDYYVQLTGKMPKKNGVLIMPDATPEEETAPLFQSQNLPNVLNALGVGSYAGDGVVDRDTLSVAGQTVPRSQLYSVWRILSRGAVTPAVLASYSSTFVVQPQVTDPITGFNAPPTDGAANANGTTNPGPVVSANRCVIWTAPYAGYLPLNTAGSISDSATQNLLRAFVNGGTIGTTVFPAGGRLFVSGSTIASTLSLGGADPALNTKGSFLNDVLNAQWQSTIPGGQPLAGQNALGSRISFDAYINYQSETLFGGQSMNFFTLLTLTNGVLTLNYQAPGGGTLSLDNNYIDQVGGKPQWRTDGSADQLGPYGTQFGGNLNSALGLDDVIAAQNGAHTDITVGGNTGLVYNENVNGSRVVYSSFGLEGQGTEYYKTTLNSVDYFVPLNQRANIMHNIVCYLRTGTFTGTIFAANSGGQTLANATVYLLPARNVALPNNARGTYSALTDSQGNYRIEGVEPGVYQVVAYKTGYGRSASTPISQLAPAQVSPFTVQGDTVASGINLNLTPVPPGTITGKVTDSTTNQGISNASIVFDDGAGTTFTVITDASGNYSVSAPAGTYSATASATGYTTSAAQTGISVSSGGSTTANFTLTPMPATIVVNAVDTSTGQPLPGVSVTLTPPTGGAAIPPQTTGADGTTTFSNVPAAVAGTTYTLTGSLAGYTDGTATQVVTSGNTFPVTLNLTPLAPATINVHVVDTGGAPLPGASVTISPDPNTASPQTTDAGGNATFPNLPATVAGMTYTLTGSLAGYTSATATQVVTPGQTPTVTITLNLAPAPATINVHVVDTGGAPLPGASVTIAPDPNTASPQTTNAAGNATFPNLPAAVAGTTYTLTATLAGYTGTPVTQTVTPGKTFAVTIVLIPPPATIDVQVVDINSGASLPGASVTIAPDPNKASPQTTDASGTATFPNLPAVNAGTTYTLAATLAGYTGATATQIVTPGKTFTVTIRLTPTPAAIIVHVVDSISGASLPGASVTISPDPNKASPQTTDARGVVTFTNLPAAVAGTSYTLTATLPGYTGSLVTQVVTPGQTFTAVIRLTPPNGTLGGLVDDSLLKTPLTGATVSVSIAGSATPIQTTTTAAATSPAAPAGDGTPQNYAFTLAPGTYNVTVTKQGFGSATLTGFKVLPAAFTRADFVDTNALKALHVFPAGYNFFSVPYDYTGTGLTFDTVFGVLNQGSFTATPPTINPADANRSHAYVWQPQLLQYVSDPTPPADTLHIGQGYWIYLNSPSELTVAGTTPSGSTVSVGLSAGWNMIGVPSTSAIPVSSLSFAGNGGTSVTFADASGATYRLIQGTLYTYPAGGTKGTSYIPVTSSGSLEPYQAYWIYAYVNTTVSIPTSATAVASARPSASPVSSSTSSTASGVSSSSSGSAFSSSSRQNTVRVRGRTH